MNIDQMELVRAAATEVLESMTPAQRREFAKESFVQTASDRQYRLAA